MKKKNGRRTLPMKEAVVSYRAPLLINVRSAKDRFSNLLDLAMEGQDVVITSDGRPKARLTAYESPKKAFRVNWELLKSIPVRKEGGRSESIVREERDSGF